VRLRDGVDAAGDALPIHVIAGALRLSPTPVREALSRLAGERLVDKRGPVYTRPRLDGPTLAALYRLRMLYLSAAMAPAAVREAARRRAPPQAWPDLAGRSAGGATPAALIEALYLALVLAADDPVLLQAYQQVADRLAPFQAVEALSNAEAAQEAAAMIAAFEARQTAALSAGVRRHHRQLMARADVLARRAAGEKYRTDIV
jgi:DNA-binding GntR family transcriptional regulator